MSIVLAALAWNITPGRSLDLLTGAVFTSPRVVDVAPMKTILPFTFLAGIVPSSTSAAEITFSELDRSGEKLSSIDLGVVGGHEPIADLHAVRAHDELARREAAVRHHRGQRERGHELGVLGIGDDERHAAAHAVARVLVEVHLTGGRAGRLRDHRRDRTELGGGVHTVLGRADRRLPGEDHVAGAVDGVAQRLVLLHLVVRRRVAVDHVEHDHARAGGLEVVDELAPPCRAAAGSRDPWC